MSTGAIERLTPHLVLGAYAVGVLRSTRRSLWWEFPAGMAAGALIGGVQLLPTLAAFAGGTRSAPAYYLFVENSYAPTSFFLWLFPFFFGARTPNLYSQPWWGWSHFCEQATYLPVAILACAIASIGLWRVDRQVRFWWALAAVCLIVALGRFTPLAGVLFTVPILNSLRVPARWVVGVDMALVVLASTLLDALLRRGEHADAAVRWLRRVVTRVLPATVLACLACMAIARVWSAEIFDFDPKIAAAVRSAVRPGNPAVWIPLVLVVLTMWTLSTLCRRPSAASLMRFSCLVGIDLAAFAAFVDVDVREYASIRSVLDPPLAREPAARRSGPGDRLWVPRSQADYHRPVEVLWPQTNVLHRVGTLHGYGPLWPLEKRLLLHFMPWGASQDAIGLLTNPRLLQALGVRRLAARSEQEAELAALAGALPPADFLPLMEDGVSVVLPRDQHLRLPVSVPAPGVYAIDFRASSEANVNRDRWSIWIEDETEAFISDVLWFDPIDHAAGPRRIRRYLTCRRPATKAVLHAWAEPRSHVVISNMRFGRLAEGGTARESAPAYRPAAELPDGVRLYEAVGVRPRFAWADRVTPASGLTDAVEKLLFEPERVGLPGGVVVEDADIAPPDPTGTVRVAREGLNHVILDVDSAAAGLLVFNDTFDAGWTASIDGRPAPIIRTNAVVQSVRVAAGAHRVEFRYWPKGLTTGIMASGLGVVAALSLAAVVRQNPRSPDA